MAWSGVWHVEVDGTDLNDGTNYISMVPEIDNQPPRDIVMAPIDGDYPVFIRSQPAAGTYTILIACKQATKGAEYWHSAIAALRALFSQDSYHTLTVQARGMSSAMSVSILVESLQADYRSKTVIVSAVAPNPTFT